MIYVCGDWIDEPVEVIILDPNGKQRIEKAYFSGSDTIFFFFEQELGDPWGVYQLILKGKNEVVQNSLVALKPDGPCLLPTWK
jgi:hypothetical protein